jgi:predicted MarR family transcription regulator
MGISKEDLMTQEITYSVSVSDWGRKGWRVSCFATANDWGLAKWKIESFHRTEKQARKKAAELAATYRANVL